MSFGRMPFGWIENDVLRQFSGAGGQSGQDIAALKCYLAIAAFHDSESGETVLSANDLKVVAGISRPMVFAGTKLLEQRGLLGIEPRADRNTNVYVLGDMGPGFRKVPQDVVVAGLRLLGSRGETSLGALRLYIAMLYFRSHLDDQAKVSHEKLVMRTGVRPERVKACYRVLEKVGLIKVLSRSALMEWSASGYATNAYELLGDFAGRKRRALRPTEEARRKRREQRESQAGMEVAR
jgi:hypothetical protein